MLAGIWTIFGQLRVAEAILWDYSQSRQSADSGLYQKVQSRYGSLAATVRERGKWRRVTGVQGLGHGPYRFYRWMISAQSASTEVK